MLLTEFQKGRDAKDSSRKMAVLAQKKGNLHHKKM
jgi:hypothetical protein